MKKRLFTRLSVVIFLFFLVVVTSSCQKRSFLEIVGKDNSKKPDYTSFVLESGEEIAKDVIENIVSGAGPLEYATEIAEDFVQEACEHLL